MIFIQIFNLYCFFQPVQLWPRELPWLHAPAEVDADVDVAAVAVVDVVAAADGDMEVINEDPMVRTVTLLRAFKINLLIYCFNSCSSFLQNH